MPQVLLIARHTMKPGAEAEVLPLVEELVRAARAEPGTLDFDAYRSMEDPDSYVLIERYATREALALHRAAAPFNEIVLERLVPLLAARTLEELDVPEASG